MYIYIKKKFKLLINIRKKCLGQGKMPCGGIKMYILFLLCKLCLKTFYENHHIRCVHSFVFKMYFCFFLTVISHKSKKNHDNAKSKKKTKKKHETNLNRLQREHFYYYPYYL